MVREFARSFRIAYPHPLWLGLNLLVVGLLAPALWLFGFPANPPAQPDALYFLLGSLPATLGTVFVLAFTFTFVAAQIASNYSRNLFNRILDIWALWYAIPFAFGILLPLYLLDGHFYLWAVQVSLLLGTFCVVSLLPFAAAVRGLLSISETIVDKNRRLLATKSDSEAQVLITDLGNISVGALALRDFETFELGIQQLTASAIMSKKASIQLQIAEELRRMIVRNVDERFASEVLLSAMIEVGLEGIDDVTPLTKTKVLDLVVDAYRTVNINALWNQTEEIRVSGRLAKAGVAECQPEIVQKYVTLLYILGERAISEVSVESESAHSAIAALGDILEAVIDSALAATDYDKLVRSIVMRIEYLGTKAMEFNKGDLKDSAQVQLQRVSDKYLRSREETRRHVEASLARLKES